MSNYIDLGCLCKMYNDKIFIIYFKINNKLNISSYIIKCKSIYLILNLLTKANVLINQ
uniref:Uncharacterized protein n=1 Tax=Porphyridium purpureum TaxID=35688 RepID=W0RZ16_PORPP|nr:hypothetical protein Y721_p188 [Porphyridium purpureum]BAO23620.1 hypothetical protein [Porphyridium purpureum]